METRTVIQTRIYKLILNPVMGRSEDSVVVAWSTELDLLLAFYRGEEVPTWVDEGKDDKGNSAYRWHKNFKKGGPLEWFNPEGLEYLGTGQYLNYFTGRGIKDEWVSQEVIDSATVLRVI